MFKIYFECATIADPLDKESCRMKIASWNVNSIKVRADLVEKWIKTQSPDILLLQELKGENFPSSRFESLGYNCFIKPQKAYNGVAILAKAELNATLITDTLPHHEEDLQARFLDIETNGMRIINIYMPNGNPVDTDKYEYKLAWMDRLYDYAQSLIDERRPFLIAGDFNVIPEASDCHDPKAWEDDALFRLEIRNKFRKLKNIGLYDAFRIFDKSSEKYTFWDYQRGAWPQNHGIRIDHFLLSPALTDRARNCLIDPTPRGWEQPSDHTPIILELS